jgi:NADH-quinone oxidoreductase subunit M
MILSIPPLVLLTLFPLLGFLVLIFIKSEAKNTIRWIAFVTSLITFGISLWVLAQFDANAPQALDLDQPWFAISSPDGIGALQVRLQMHVDGISLLMVLLTTFLTPIAIASTWNAVQERVKGFMMFFLLLETGMLGVFVAVDLILFYIFWEFTLIPMYFLIGAWGGERRIYAAIKFFLFTMAGSVLMLVAILYIANTAGTFSLMKLVEQRALFEGAQTLLFLAFGLAFAIKVPMFPLHTWLPDAHVEAPTAGSVILAGVLLKMGVYGFLRFNLPLFPQATLQLAPYMALLAVIGIIYGAAVAYAQKDVKKLVAYSSVSHLGFVVLGIFALNTQGVSGAVLQMVNHGLSTGALFLIVGFLYERRHTRQMLAFGGIWKVMPVLAAFSLVITLSSMGLPGLNGFVGEFIILQGAYASTTLGGSLFAILAALGVILAAVYLLHMFEKVFLGPLENEENKKLADLNWREIALLVPLLVVIFWIGLYPKFFFDLIQPAVTSLLGGLAIP